MSSRRRHSLLTCILILGLVGTCTGLMMRHYRTGAHTKKLYSAVASGNAERVRQLLEAGADPNVWENPPDLRLSSLLREIFLYRRLPSGRGVRALNRAVHDSRIDIVRLLLEHGADPTARDADSYQRDALHAASIQSPEYIALLLSHGADVNSRDGNASTPLMLAATWDNTEAVKLLLENGADINAADAGGYMALHYACINRWGQIAGDCIRVLVSHGADRKARTRDGATPLSILNKSHYMKSPYIRDKSLISVLSDGKN